MARACFSSSAALVRGPGFILGLLLLAGCSARGPAAEITARLDSPYPEDRLWAAVPLRNDSGVSVLDPLVVTDTLVNEMERVHRIRTLPLDRTLEAMAAADLQRVESPADVAVLMRTLDVDGLVTGSITAWDPYPPTSMGLALQLHVRPDLAAPLRTGPNGAELDVRTLATSAAGSPIPGDGASGPARSGASGHYDARENRTRLAVERFASGRTVAETPVAWERYLRVMDLFTEFACHAVLEDLLEAERVRVVRSGRRLGRGPGRGRG